LIAEIAKFLEEKDAIKFVDGLKQYSSVISGDEYVKIKLDFPKTNPNTMFFLIPSENYNINLKATTITILLIILDIATLSISDNLLKWAGIDIKTQGLYKLNEAEGEKCVVVEILRKESRTADMSILPPPLSKCVNNNFNCKYNRDGKCQIKKSKVIKCLTKLCEKNVLQKQGDTYKYNF